MQRVAIAEAVDGDFPLASRGEEILTRACKESGFVPEEEIFRGTVYGPENVGTLIVRGTHEGRPAALKLQGIEPPRSEAFMLEQVSARGYGTGVRAPEVYDSAPWNQEAGYGWTVMEHVQLPKLFTPPQADEQQRRRLCAFHDALAPITAEAWFDNPHPDARAYIGRRIGAWTAFMERQGRFRYDEVAPDAARFLTRLAQEIEYPMAFCHGHLTGQDVGVDGEGFVVFSNLFWSWKPLYYDLAFNVWSCVMAIDPVETHVSQTVRLVEEWRGAYRSLAAAQRDPEFERRLLLMLQERLVGTLLADLSGDRFADMHEAYNMRHHLTGLLDRLGAEYDALAA